MLHQFKATITPVFIACYLAVVCFVVSGQSRPGKASDDAEELRLNKIIAVDEVGIQLKSVSMPAVRVYAQFLLAKWLLKKGVDDTDRALPLLRSALDELYAEKNHIPGLYVKGLETDIFALLQGADRSEAERIKTKYGLTAEDDLRAELELIGKGDSGDKQAGEKILQFASRGELGQMSFWLLHALRDKKSKEFPSILDRLTTQLASNERRPATVADLLFLVDFFREEAVSSVSRQKFYLLVLATTRDALLSPNDTPIPAFNLINACLDDIATNAPNLVTEASSLRTVLLSRIPKSVVEREAVYARVAQGPNRLSALLAEAETAEDITLKRQLLTEAAELALRRGNFKVAIEAFDNVAGLPKSDDKSLPLWRTQFLLELIDKVLSSNEPDFSTAALKRLDSPVGRGEALTRIARYHVDNREPNRASESLEEALKILSKEQDDMKKVNLLLRMVTVSERTNQNSLTEVTRDLSKALGRLPGLDVSAKPGSQDSNNYISMVMGINYNLYPALSNLQKRNSNEARELVSRIDRREFRVIAEIALLVNSTLFAR